MHNFAPTPFVTEEDSQGIPIRSYEVRARANLFALEGMMKEGNANGLLVPFECPVEHFFAPGVYIRRMTIPAGVALVGHIHRHPCWNVVVGEIIVYSGDGRKRIIGPTTFESPAGMKRAGHAITDTIWMTVHTNPTDERDIDKLEAELIVDVYDKITGKPIPELVAKL